MTMQKGLSAGKSAGPSKKVKKDYRLLIYLLPCLVLVIAFGYVPIAGWILAFLDYIPGISLKESPFVGLKYFELILSDSANMLRVMKNTVVLSIINKSAEKSNRSTCHFRGADDRMEVQTGGACGGGEHGREAFL